MRDEILERLRALAAEKLAIDPASIHLDQRLVEDLELDSIGLLTLTVEVENHFRVQLEPEDEVAIETVGDLVALLRERVARAEAPP